MNQPNIDDISRLQQWAARQLADYDARQPGMLFAEGLVLNVAQGYALQSAVAELRLQRGEQIAGYKVGCTSKKIRDQLGIDHCVTGRLFDSEQHSSGSVLSRREFANLAIEGELGIELWREPSAEDFLSDGIPACVGRVFPVIELHHHVMRGEQPSAGELIANNAIHAGLVCGGGVGTESATGSDLGRDSETSLSIFADDRILGECRGNVLVQTIRSSLEWLVEVLRDRNERLCAGQVVLTGSIPNLFSIEEDCRIRVNTSPFGSVDVRFVA